MTTRDTLLPTIAKQFSNSAAAKFTGGLSGLSERPWKACRCFPKQWERTLKDRIKSGRTGEDLAAGYLLENNYKIIGRNYRCPLGEIDIIARDGQKIVFVEVKSKNSGRFGRPEEAVDRKKQAKLSRVALFYLKSKSALDAPARFDVVSVYMDRQGPPVIRLYKNAFDLAL